MEKSEFKNKWYYRLLKVLYYIIYIWGIFSLIITAIIGLVIYQDFDMIFWSLISIPFFIVLFKLIISVFNYIFWWEWNFELIEDIKKVSKLYNEDKYWIIWINRMVFNTVFIIEITFLVLFTSYILHNWYNSNLFINLILSYSIFIIIFFYIAFKRFHNIWKSRWNTFALFIPLYQFYLLYLLIFKPWTLNVDKKLEKEKFWNIIVVLIFIWYWIISNEIKKYI